MHVQKWVTIVSRSIHHDSTCFSWSRHKEYGKHSYSFQTWMLEVIRFYFHYVSFGGLGFFSFFLTHLFQMSLLQWVCFICSVIRDVPIHVWGWCVMSPSFAHIQNSAHFDSEIDPDADSRSIELQIISISRGDQNSTFWDILLCTFHIHCSINI